MTMQEFEEKILSAESEVDKKSIVELAAKEDFESQPEWSKSTLEMHVTEYAFYREVIEAAAKS